MLNVVKNGYMEYLQGMEESDTSGKYSGSECEDAKRPIPFNQEVLDDLKIDLGLCKALSELPASRLQERNLVTKEINVSFYCTRKKKLLPLFSTEDDFIFAIIFLTIGV